MTNKWRQMSDDDLMQEADTGMRGSGAIIEMLRRLRNKGITVLSLVITAVGVVVVALQLYLQWRGCS
jgi:hypothetical protein